MTVFEVIEEDECYELLRTVDIGRFAVTDGDYPAVFPVNYVLDGNTVTFRTAQGTKLDASQHGNICFEVDDVSPDRRSAWSVLIFGVVDHMGVDINKRPHVEQLDIRAVATHEKPAWVRIIAHRITGRRFAHKEDSHPPFDAHGYL